MAALNSQTHTYTRTRLRFHCLQVCFLIWSGCTDQINRIFSSCFHHAQERAEFSNDIHGLSDRKGMGTGGCDLRGSSAERRRTASSFGRLYVAGKKKGEKISGPAAHARATIPAMLINPNPEGPQWSLQIQIHRQSLLEYLGFLGANSIFH